MVKIMTVVGARPQFIKVAPFSREVAKHDDVIEVLVHTGQHYDDNLSKYFFDELKLPKPDFNLGIGSGSPGEQTGKMMAALEKTAFEIQPDLILVYGDTNSTLAAALVGSMLHIPVAHVEAGVRCWDKHRPEEVNRVVTDYCASLRLCPVESAVGNLKKERITDNVFVTGDIMLDTYNLFKKKAQKSKILEKLKLKDYTLVTVHRAEHTNDPEILKNIFDAFSKIKGNVVFPMHPRTKKFMQRYGIVPSKNLKLIEPASYLDFMKLEMEAKLILTDSGGVQREAYWNKVPCIILSKYTEWTELLETGIISMIDPADKDLGKKISIFNPKLEKDEEFFGKSPVAEKILKQVLEFLK